VYYKRLVDGTGDRPSAQRLPVPAATRLYILLLKASTDFDQLE
jgi:hypothetical protein